MAGAGNGQERPRWRENGGDALLRTDMAGGRSLAAVIAILTFVAALAAAAAEQIRSSATAWSQGIAQEATIQIRPRAGRDVEADLAAAGALARATPGIAAAEPLPRAEAERLLEPWLGGRLDLSDLPVPRLVALRLTPDRRPDLADLGRRLAAIPGATLDDHAVWRRRLAGAAATAVATAFGLVALVLLATALAVAFATRGALAGSREVVEVLHYVGATDRFIVRIFVRHFLRLALVGALAGAAAACGVALAAAAWLAGPAGLGDGGALLELSAWPALAAALLLPAPLAGAAAALASGLAVKRFLNHLD